MNYIRFIVENWRFLAFGVVLNLFASTGQTYYISILGGQFRADFNLSHADFGLVYGLATVASAASLIVLGRFIDRIDLRLYTVLVCIGIIAATFSPALAFSTFTLWLSLYVLRLMGQGLMNHTSVTSMARYFHHRRGAAVSIVSFGNTIGIALFPTIGVALVAWIGWRQSWVVVGIVYALVLIPLILWLLKGHDVRHQAYLTAKSGIVSAKHGGGGDGSVGDVLTDLRFYLILPAVMTPSFILTGFIFHQVHLAAVKNWSLAVYAGGYTGFAVASITVSLAYGVLVDRFSAFKLLPLLMLPFILFPPLLALFDHIAFGLIFLIGMGAGLGGMFTIIGSLWAEIYGTTHLGAIRSMSQALMVFSSALSPWIFGLLIDAAFSMGEIAWFCVAMAAAATALAVAAGRVK